MDLWRVGERLDRADRRVTRWMARWGVMLLRLSVGLVFLWFGGLKFFPGASPAESLATDTIVTLTGGRLSADAALLILAVWETAIGIGLLTRKLLRITLLLLFLQMPGTILPMFLFPEQTFRSFPFMLTLEGQYIVKNLVLVSAAIVIGSHVRDEGWMEREDD